MSRKTWKNPIIEWIDYRLPIFSFMDNELGEYPMPKNLNYWWNAGFVGGVMLMVLIITGIFLAMYYTPHVDYAFVSIERIMRDVNYGWLIRYLHSNGSSMFFLVIYIHMFRGLYYGSYKNPREVLWIIGVVIILIMVPAAFMGYVLVWGQMSFWAATVITSMFSVIPWFGEDILHWLWGGYSVSNPTLNRFFSFHYLVPFIILGLVFVHLWALHVHKSSNPLGIDPKGPQDTIPFSPYYTIKDLFGLSAVFVVFMFFVFFAPNFFAEPDNYIPAMRMKTPHQIVPEWYLLPYYTLLKVVPHKTLGVIVMFAAQGLLLVAPWLDTSKVRSCKFRPIYRQFFWILVVDVIVLGWAGAYPPEGIYLLIGRIATVYYFAHFLIVMPVVGWLERPSQLPESISAAVTKEGSGRVKEVG